MEVKLDDIKLMTQQQVADILGVTKETIRQMCVRREIAWHLISGRRKISNYDLKEYLKRTRMEMQSSHQNDMEEDVNDLYAAPDDVQL